MERVKYSKVEVKHGNSVKKFPVYEIYLDDMIVTKVSSEMEAVEMLYPLALTEEKEIYYDKADVFAADESFAKSCKARTEKYFNKSEAKRS